MKAKSIAQRYIGPGATVLYESDLVMAYEWPSHGGKAITIAIYSRRRTKPDFCFYSKEQDTLRGHMLERCRNMDRNLSAQDKEKAERRLCKASDYYKVGDIVLNTWGWEQTNVDWYEVVAVTPRAIRVTPIAGAKVEGSMYSHGMACNMVPVPGVPSDIRTESYLLRVYKGGRLSNPESYYHFRKWDGRPQYCSWYA